MKLSVFLYAHTWRHLSFNWNAENDHRVEGARSFAVVVELTEILPVKSGPSYNGSCGVCNCDFEGMFTLGLCQPDQARRYSGTYFQPYAASIPPLGRHH